MPVMDEFKEERAAIIKQGTFKEKVSYFLDYYKWHTIVIVIAIVFTVSLVSQMLSQKDIALYVAMLNTVKEESAEEYVQQFAQYADVNTKKHDIVIDTSMYIDMTDLSKLDAITQSSIEKLLIYIASGNVDVVISNETVHTSYAYNGAFHDLRTILTEEQFAKYEPYFYYMDQDFADQMDTQSTLSENYDTVLGYPAGRNPENMGNPIPVGIYLDGASELKENYEFFYEDMILGVPVNIKNLKMASIYIDFVLP